MSTKFSSSCAYGKIARIIPNGIGLNAKGQIKSIDDSQACQVNNTAYGNAECSNAMDHTLINY
jgi:hypothetical protein